MHLHVQYGGVVPEIAARSHIEVIIPVIERALQDAKTDWDGVDAIAVTYGAGLGGSLLIGVLTARTMAIAHKKPLYAICLLYTSTSSFTHRHCEELLRRSNPGVAACGPWIASFRSQ